MSLSKKAGKQMKKTIYADELIKALKELNMKQGGNITDIQYSLADIIYIIDLMPTADNTKRKDKTK